MSLTLTLRRDDLFRTPGVTIRFKNSAKIELLEEVAFLFGKQILSRTEAKTHLQQLYFAVQEVYVGKPERQKDWIERARELFAYIPSFSSASETSLEETRLIFEKGKYYEALCGLRKLAKQT